MIDQVQLSGALDWNRFRLIQLELATAIKREKVIEIELDFSGVTKIYPNGVVPLIVLMEHLRIDNHARFSVVGANHLQIMESQDYLAHLVPDAGLPLRGGPSALQSFSNDYELNDLINHKIDQVLGQAQFAPGVLTAFEWFLNEIAGNVLVHSGASKGWLQVVVHPKTHHLTVVVADGGAGIPDSIRGSKLLQEQFGTDLSDADAIEIALRYGVTSRPDYGQGKGLTGTMSIVKANRGGRMAITSQEGRVFYAPGSIGLKVQNHLPPLDGTLVDLQLDFSEPLEIEKALWGHAPVSFTETMYGKDTPAGIMRMTFKTQAASFGNRITAERIRKKIENLLIEAPSDDLEIDFEGVSMLASSFADEVFGKLAARMGVIGFSRRLRFINMNAFCQGIIDDAVQTRMAQTYSDKNGQRS